MNSAGRKPQPQWMDTAGKLHLVRRTCLQFLDRWAIGHLLSDAPGLDRVAGDVHGSAHADSADADAAIAEKALSDPANRDWSILYRGSVLDD